MARVLRLKCLQRQLTKMFFVLIVGCVICQHCCEGAKVQSLNGISVTKKGIMSVVGRAEAGIIHLMDTGLVPMSFVTFAMFLMDILQRLFPRHDHHHGRGGGLHSYNHYYGYEGDHFLGHGSKGSAVRVKSYHQNDYKSGLLDSVKPEETIRLVGTTSNSNYVTQNQDSLQGQSSHDEDGNILRRMTATINSDNSSVNNGQSTSTNYNHYNYENNHYYYHDRDE